MEIIILNMIMAFICFWLYYFIYRKDFTLAAYAKITIPTFIIYYIFYFGAVASWMYYWRTEVLWFPYIFGGMPAHSIGGIGVKWFNHITVFVGAVRNLLFNNPIGVLLFSLTIYWFIIRWRDGKKVIANYFLIVFAELSMIITTTWK